MKGLRNDVRGIEVYVALGVSNNGVVFFFFLRKLELK